MFLGCGFAPVSLPSSPCSLLSLSYPPGKLDLERRWQCSLTRRSFIIVALPLGGQIYQTLRFGLRVRPPSRWTTSFDVTQLKTEQRIGTSTPPTQLHKSENISYLRDFSSDFVLLRSEKSESVSVSVNNLRVTLSLMTFV